MFGTFGNITFELLKAPQSFSHKKETEFAEHARINNKPMLQKTGEKLDEITIQVQFHVSFCDPTAEAATIEAARKSATAEALVFGNGEFVGTFVISAITKTLNEAFADGSPLCSTLDLTLREVVSSSPLLDMAQAAVGSAFATSGDTPLPIIPSTSTAANPAAQVMEYVGAATIGATQASAEVAKAAKSVDYIDRASTAIAKATQAVTDALNKVDTVMSAHAALQQQASNLDSAVSTARASAANLEALTPIQSVGDVQSAADNLRADMKLVNTASAPIATISSYRGFF